MRILLLIVVLLGCALLVQAEKVTIKVVDTEGKPVPGASLYFYNFISSDILYLRNAVSQTNKQGLYTGDIKFSTNYHRPSDVWANLTVYAPGYGMTGASIARGETVVTLAPAAQIWGTVIDAAGKPLAGVTVRLADLYLPPRPLAQSMFHLMVLDSAGVTAKTTADGRWSITGVPAAGWAKVTVDDPRYLQGSTSCDLGLGAIAPPIIMHTGGSITGKVVSEDGKPLAGMSICAEGNAVDPHTPYNKQYSTSDTEGIYRFTHLPAGSWDLTASDPKDTRITVTPAHLIFGMDADIAADPIVMMKGAVVQCSVFDDATGKSLPHVTITARQGDRRDDLAPVWWTAWLGSEHAFVLFG